MDQQFRHLCEKRFRPLLKLDAVLTLLFLCSEAFLPFLFLCGKAFLPFLFLCGKAFLPFLFLCSEAFLPIVLLSSETFLAILLLCGSETRMHGSVAFHARFQKRVRQHAGGVR